MIRPKLTRTSTLFVHVILMYDGEPREASGWFQYIMFAHKGFPCWAQAQVTAEKTTDACIECRN